MPSRPNGRRDLPIAVRPKAQLETAKVGGRVGPARGERGRASVRAAWGREVVGRAVVGRADHLRPSGLSSMPWSLTPMAMANSTAMS